MSMLIGVGTVGQSYNGAFNARLTNTYDYIRLDNMVLDEIYASNWEDIGFDTPKLEWSEYTCFLGEFKNSLECGNFKGIEGNDITHIAFLKREAYTDNDWVTLDILPYDHEAKTHLYKIKDTLAFAGEYEYGIQPLVIEEGCTYSNCMKGEITSVIAKVEFNNLFITDGDNIVCLKFELDYGTIKNTNYKSKYETIGRKKPIFQKIAETDYDEGTIKAKVLSYESQQGKLNNVADWKVVNAIKNMINSNRSLLMKDGNGLRYIFVGQNVQIGTTKEFQGGFLDIQFDWTDVGDGMNTEDLIDNDLLKDFSGYPLY